MAEVDQSVVDEILAKASEDTEEGRLEKLEREVETLKGSIKRLLLDIRETMNRLENPFANLQSLAEANIVPQSAPQIQIVPASIPKAEEKVEETREEMEEEVEAEEEREDMGVQEEVLRPDKAVELKKESKERESAKIETLMDKEVKIEPAEMFKGKAGKMDFTTLYNLMEWVHGMISKHSYESFKLMLEVFEMTGYVSSDTKELIMKLADLVKVNGTKDVLIELYMLHKVFNPNDRSMDSDLLSLLLKKR